MSLPIAQDSEELDLSYLSATICAELAAGLASAAGIREKYSISKAQWEALKTSPVFRGMLKEAMAEWSGDLNAMKRIQKKAQIMLEDSLPRLYDIAHDAESPRQHVLESFKRMQEISGIGSGPRAAIGKDGMGGGDAAIINIHIVTKSGQEERTIIEATPSLPAGVPASDESDDDF